MKKTEDLAAVLKYIESLSNIPMFGIDLFCGCGGLTEGAEEAEVYGLKCCYIVSCVNHDKNAIKSHRANHPYAFHAEEDIRTLDISPLKIIVDHIRKHHPGSKILLHASAECTNMSRAKGGMSRDADSRSLPEHIYRYIEILDPDYVTLENVREFLIWGPLEIKVMRDKETGYEYCPLEVKKKKKTKKRKAIYEVRPVWVPIKERKSEFYNAWRDRVKGYGYNYEYKLLDAANFGAHTSRTRYFGIFSKPGCYYEWPIETHAKVPGKGKQRWEPVKNVLDFSLEGESIWDRKKNLSPKTHKRIMAGCVKFVAGGKDKWLLKYNSINKETGVHIPPSIDDPCPTVSCQGRLGLVETTFLSKAFSGHPDSKNVSIEEPAGSVTTKDHHQVIKTDFLAAYYSTGDNVSSIDAPCPVVSTKDRFNLIEPKWINSYNYKDEPKDLNAPCPTLLTKDRYSVVSPEFLMNQYSGGGQVSGIDQPNPSVTTVPKQNLIKCTFIDQQYGNSKPKSVEDPCNSVTTNPKYAKVDTEWIMNTSFGNVGSGIEEPAPTILASRKHHYLMNPQYNSAGGDINAPCFTLIARMDKMPPYLMEADREIAPGKKIPSFIKIEEGCIIYHIFDTDTPEEVELKEFMAAYGIIDIKMRMLVIPELKRIMGFPEDYILIGTQEQQKKYIGNAVEVKQAKAFIEGIARGMLNYELKIAL